MIYENATVWDAQKITELWTKATQELKHNSWFDPELFFIKCLTWIKKPNCAVVVVKDNDKIIGFISGTAELVEYAKEIMVYCSHVYIEPEYRGMDILEKLVFEITQRLKPFNYKASEFITAYDPILIRFWEKMGYAPARIVFRKEV